MILKHWTRQMLGLLLVTAPDGLHAQGSDDNMVTPSLPLEFDRGRNIGVLDRPRPEYTSQGVPVGGFTLQPKAELGVGYTSNAYQNTSDQGDGYVVFAPSAVVSSNWSRHDLTLSGGGNFYRYFTEGRRNRDGWNGALEGRFDATADVAIAASARVRKDAEPPTSAAYPTAAAQARNTRPPWRRFRQRPRWGGRSCRVPTAFRPPLSIRCVPFRGADRPDQPQFADA
jgi:hypothetical protein